MRYNYYTRTFGGDDDNYERIIYKIFRFIKKNIYYI